MYDWLYYVQVAQGHLCKICEIFRPTGGRGRGAWNHNVVIFHGNAGKKL